MFGYPYEFVLAKPTVEGRTPLKKTVRLTSQDWILNSLILEYYQFWEIRILILLVEEFPDRIMTYNLDFRSFWLSKGGTTIFQKKQKFIF